jgi:hypothetical protein
MTPPILDDISTWFVDWSLITIMGNTMRRRRRRARRTAGRQRNPTNSPHASLTVAPCERTPREEGLRSARAALSGPPMVPQPARTPTE